MNMEIVPILLFSSDLEGTCFLFLRPFLIFGIILQKTVCFLVLDSHIFRQHGNRLKPLFLMCQIQIITHQFLQKLRCTGTICQHMKHFKIDSFFIISHLKKKCLLIFYIKPAARLFILFLYDRMQVTWLQIMPE